MKESIKKTKRSLTVGRGKEDRDTERGIMVIKK